MNRDDFTGLPLSLALGVLWDNSSGIRATLEKVEAPKRARPPKYDSAIYRKEGVTYASEYDAEGLRFWHKRKADSAASGGQWAEKDAKAAEALAFWIEWREQNPSAIWSGERNRKQVTANAPSWKPAVYQREDRGPTPARTSGGGFSDSDYGASDKDSDLDDLGW